MRYGTWMVSGAIVIAPAAWLGGCGSLDARPDVDRAAWMVQERTGELPAWLAAPEDERFPERLDERTAVRMALRRDPRLLQELERIAEARADLVQSGLLPNPVLALDLGFPIDGSGGATKIGVGLTEQLTLLLTRDDRMSAADAELRARVLECSERALETASRARAAHARVLFAREALVPVREAVGDAEKAVEQARRRVAAGEDTSLEVNRQRLLLVKLTTEFAERESTLEIRRRELLARLGWASYAGAFEVDAAAAGDAGGGVMSEDDVIAQTRGQRLDIAAANAMRDAAMSRVGAERKGRLDFAAGAAFERTDDGRRELGPSMTVGLPVFDWGDARVAKGEAEARRLSLEAQRIEQDAIAEARGAFVAEKTARDLLGRYEREIGALAGQNLDLARRAFGAGQADLTVLLEAQQQVADARVRVVDLRERAQLARIELERAVGGKLGVR
jgi:outer membrane protein, heavy metal efflux system